jgi:hypothetical protein
MADELLVELRHSQHAGSVVNDALPFLIESHVLDVDAPRHAQHERDHAPRIKAWIGGRELRIAPDEQPRADHEHDGQRDLRDHQRAEHTVPPPR